ncbi:hypothetical protein [Thiobacillus sp.]
MKPHVYINRAASAHVAKKSCRAIEFWVKATGAVLKIIQRGSISMLEKIKVRLAYPASASFHTRALGQGGSVALQGFQRTFLDAVQDIGTTGPFWYRTT